jgi:hypothetical protein
VRKKLTPLTELLPAKNNTVTYEDTTDISGSRFYAYAAKSENASHFQGDFSEIVYARSSKPVSVPVVMGLTADFYDTYNKLFWTNMQFGETTVQGYFVYRQELPSGTLKQLNDTLLSPEVNSYTDRTIYGRKPYAYSVVLVDEFGNKSSKCNPVSVIPPAIPVIPPSSVAGNSEQTLIRISWNEVRSTTLKEYRVYRYIRGSKPTIVRTLPAGSATVITDKNVTKDQLYFYYLTTVDKDGRESKPSDEISVRKE